jgi:hypothetical protein
MKAPAATELADAGVPSPQAARCPRCGQGFHCGVDDGQPCACGSVALDGPLRAVLRQRYSSCLCGDCLRALVQQGIHIG